MTSLLDNPCVADPRRKLTGRQQVCLKVVGRFEGRRIKNGWQYASDRFSLTLTDALKERGLVVERNIGFSKRLRLTMAGQLALERLNRTAKEKKQ